MDSGIKQAQDAICLTLMCTKNMAEELSYRSVNSLLVMKGKVGIASYLAIYTVGEHLKNIPQ